jgi:circadian clock protein KaiC
MSANSNDDHFPKGGIESLYRSTYPKSGIVKKPTGIPGLDNVLLGGLPKDRLTIVSGDAGAGKTILVSEFLYQGVTQFNEPGVFVTFEEHPDDIIKNVRGFGWDFGKLVQDSLIAFVDVSHHGDAQVELNQNYDLTPILIRIKYVVEQVGAKRIVLDSIGSLLAQFNPPPNPRSLFNTLGYQLREMGVTTIITTERSAHAKTPFSGVEAFVADCVIELSMSPNMQGMGRALTVRKLRGADFCSGCVEYGITDRGLEIYPKIPINRTLANMDFANLKQFGIPGFDEISGGGVPEGHLVLVSGNTGTGKSTFAMHYALEGGKSDEAVVYVALEEPSGQILKTAAEHDWDFDELAKKGILHFINVPLLNISTDKLLYEIVDTVLKTKSKRIVIDSISSLESGSLVSEDVRQFLIQLMEFCKSHGVTCLLTYLCSGVFGAVRGQLLGHMQPSEMQLSSVVDGVILLRYVERGQKVKRLVNVLKMRGRAHAKEIYLYEVRKEGIWIGEKYEE